jgi:hypothetical protein
MELPNKLRLDGPLWLAVQQHLSNGWGPVIGAPPGIGGLIISVTLAMLHRKRWPRMVLYSVAAIAYGAMTLSSAGSLPRCRRDFGVRRRLLLGISPSTSPTKPVRAGSAGRRYRTIPYRSSNRHLKGRTAHGFRADGWSARGSHWRQINSDIIFETV